MRFWEQIASWLGLRTESQQTRIALQNKLERIRRLKYSQEYDDAYHELDDAISLATTWNNPTIGASLELQRADILIQQERWTDAETLLEQLKRSARTQHHQEFLAHITITQGLVAQRKHDWDTARILYEQALRIAREAKGLSAEGRAQGYLADTYMHEGNISFAVYLLEESLQKLSLSGDIEQSSYFIGRLGEAKIEMGQLQQGQHLLGRALRLAESLHYKQHELMWRQALAALAVSQGQYEEARKQYMLILAQSDARMLSEEYIRTLCRASKTCLRLAESQAALDYAQQAVELASRVSNQNHILIMAQAALGIALRSLGERVAEAIPYLETAAREYENVPKTKADYTYVDLLRNLAAAQAETNATILATATYDQALQYAQTHGSPLELAGAYRDKGILVAQQHKLQDAIKLWTAALEIYESQHQYARVARLYCDIANVRKQLGQPRRAMKDYEQALMLLSSFDDPETRGIVLSNAATTYVDYGDIETAESFFVDAIKIALKLQDRHAEATRRGNFGWFLLSTGRAERALATLSYALQQSESLGLSLQAAVQLDNMGLAHDELNHYEKALEYHRAALEKIQPLNAPQWEAIIRANLAHNLIELQQLAEAEQHLDWALESGRTLDNAEIIIRALIGKGKVALQQNQLDALGKYAIESVELAERVGGRRLLAESLVIRSEFLYLAGHAEQASADWTEARKLLEILHIRPETHAPSWLSGKRIVSNE